MTFLDHFNNKWHFLMIKKFVYNFLYLLTLCSSLLNSMRIFALKKFFLTSSKYFTETNSRKHFFELATNLIYINMKYLNDVRHSQFSQKISWAFLTSWPPKMKHYQNEETRNWNFKNLYLNVFLTKFLMEILPLMIIWRISTVKTLKVFDFIIFYEGFHF